MRLLQLALAALLCVALAADSNAMKHQKKHKGVKFNKVGLSGAGFLFLYEASVMDYLVSKKVVDVTTAEMAGTSGGSIVAGALCSGLNLTSIINLAIQGIDDCTADKYYCDGTLSSRLLANLDLFLPKDNEWKSCDKRIFIQVTQANASVTPPCPANPESYALGGQLISKYQSRADLINVIVTSAYVMPYSSFVNCSYPMRPKFNGIDGGYSNILPCPPGKGSCLTISAFPLGYDGIATADIYPGIRGNTTYPIDPATLYEQAALFAPEAKELIPAIVQAGQDDAAYWLSLQTK